MSNLTTREFWASTAERAVRTAAQTAIALIGTNQVGILSLDWAQIGSVVATATVLAVLTAIAGDAATKNGPAFVRAEGIGVANAEAEEALRALNAGELNPSTDVSFASDASESDDWDDDEASDLAPEGTDPAEVDATPPPEGWEPRH